MTLEQAFSQLTESSAYKDIAKLKNSKGGKYRVYLQKFKKKELGPGAIVPILIEHGYEVKANKARKKK